MMQVVVNKKRNSTLSWTSLSPTSGRNYKTCSNAGAKSLKRMIVITRCPASQRKSGSVEVQQIHTQHLESGCMRALECRVAGLILSVLILIYYF